MTADDVALDALDLMQRWISVTRQTLSDVASQEAAHDKRRSKREKAKSRWVIYLGVLLIKAAEGVDALARVKNVRAMIILARSMFEYQQKAEYFLSHRKEAFEQYGSIGARKHAALSKLQHRNPNSVARLTADYLEWKRTSGSRNERSGNVALSTMHLKNTKPSEIKVDKDGTEYTTEFQTLYGVPSLFVHGEPPLMPEVFRDMNDDSDWSFREDVTYFDVLSIVNGVNADLMKFIHKTGAHYGLPRKRIWDQREQIKRVLQNTVRVHGL
jgi:hypothetical protein